MRLIDADALRKCMYHEAFEKDSDMQKWDSGCWIRYKMFEEALENAPTIDAEPVRRGRWVWDRHIGEYRCSECKKLFEGLAIEISEGEYRFCPNCGAKMDEEEDDA